MGIAERKSEKKKNTEKILKDFGRVIPGKGAPKPGCDLYMKFVNGIDLSTREVHDKNTYDTIISVIKNNNNNQNIIKNEIFNLTKAILYSNDEYKIMIYNLLILSFIKFYTNEINLDSEEDKIIFNPLLLPFFFFF